MESATKSIMNRTSLAGQQHQKHQKQQQQQQHNSSLMKTSKCVSVDVCCLSSSYCYCFGTLSNANSHIDNNNRNNDDDKLPLFQIMNQQQHRGCRRPTLAPTTATRITSSDGVDFKEEKERKNFLQNLSKCKLNNKKNRKKKKKRKLEEDGEEETPIRSTGTPTKKSIWVLDSLRFSLERLKTLYETSLRCNIKTFSILPRSASVSTSSLFLPSSSSSSSSTLYRILKYFLLLLLTLLFITTYNNNNNIVYCHYVNGNVLNHKSFLSPSSSSSSFWYQHGRSLIYPQQQQQEEETSSVSIAAAAAASIEKDAPEFIGEMSNQTIALGRDVIFECIVNHLGSYKLAWLKIDSLNNNDDDYGNVAGDDNDEMMNGEKFTGNNNNNNRIIIGGRNFRKKTSTEPELISIQTQIISKDNRFKVSNTNQKHWFLHIKQIKPHDKGWYMCQINTEPLISQAAYLDILIAPSIDYNATSSDVSVDERHRLSIRCRATGHPTPTITWRREDNKDINLGLYGGKRYSAKKVDGEFLNITQVIRDDMGAYLCIASNSVPPSVSKRIIVHVNFRPKIKVSNQLVGSTIGSDVQLECRCEAYPRPISTWIRYDGQQIDGKYHHHHQQQQHPFDDNNNIIKYNVSEEHDSYRTKMKLKIFNLDEKDFGSYKCVAKNSLGEKEGLVRLYEIAPPSTPYMLSSWPTYIYTYQGRGGNQQQQNPGTDGSGGNRIHHNNHQNYHLQQHYPNTNFTQTKLGFDYNDYHQASASSSSSASISCSFFPTLSSFSFYIVKNFLLLLLL